MGKVRQLRRQQGRNHRLLRLVHKAWHITKTTADWVLSASLDLFTNAYFLVVAAIVLAMFGVVGVMNIFVACSIIVSCLTTFAGISRSLRIRVLPPNRRLLVLCGIAIFIVFIGNWSIDQMLFYYQKNKSVVSSEIAEFILNKAGLFQSHTPKSEVTTIETKKKLSEPNFALLKTEFRTTAPSSIRFRINNTGEKDAIGFTNRMIIVDHHFLREPYVSNYSDANEMHPNVPKVYTELYSAPTEASYVIFAISYKSKETKKRRCQVWYLDWLDTDSRMALGTEFGDVTIAEQKTIREHLTDTLRDYLECTSMPDIS